MMPLLVAATVAGAVVALGFVLSPLTVICGAAAIAMCWATIVRLEGAERTWVTRVLAIAVGARFVVVAALLLATRPMTEPFRTLFPDSVYLIDRSLWIRNVWLGVPIGPHQALQIVEPYGASSYPMLLAVIQYVLGPAPYGLALLSVVLYTAGVLLLHRIVRERFGAVPATLGLALLFVWPSLFLWSASVLKESFQFLLTAVVVGGLYYAVRSRRWLARLAWLAALAAAIAALSSLRSGAAEIAAVTVGFAIVLQTMAARRWLAVAMIALAVAGVAVKRERFMDAVRLAANRHVGYWGSSGQSYQLLDDPFYGHPASTMTMTFAECVKFLARAAGAFVVIPLPWRAASVSEMILVPQQLLWYLIVAAAAAGASIGWRRDAWMTSIFAGAALAGLVIIAPNSGNIGTLVRHRDLIAPFVVWLGVIGAVPIAQALLSSSPAEAEA